ncbi:MAG: biopolymer transporter ExbD [Zoogloeaceae bacterium]|jgi:biopolymer transport protein ExbD|nr:biopolymer transporter ExbD [Zoogloeaceae bacterium]
MSMNVSASDTPEVMVEMNTTPLIDVMLVLLIMLIITIPIQLHSVNLDMPVGNPPPPLVPPEIVQVRIEADGNVYWNGTLVNDHASLERQLADLSRQAVPPELHIRPDRAVSYRHVAGVMAAVQRNGLTKVGLVGSEQFL